MAREFNSESLARAGSPTGATPLPSSACSGSATGLPVAVMPRRRVALVCHYFPHYRTGTLEKLASSPSHEYWFVADTQDPQRAGIRGSSIEQHSRFRALRTWVWGKLFFQPALLRWAWRRDIDTLVIAAVPHCLSYWVVPWLARLRGKRVIFWTIGWIQDERGFKNWLRVRFYSLANAWLFYGHFGKQMAIQRGFPADKLHVVYNALNYRQQVAARQKVTVEDLQQVRQELFAEPALPILVCCSRLQPHRQLHLVIAAMRLLADRGSRVQLLLIGDGPERERLESQAREAGVPVHFYGACYDEPTLARLIMAADLTVAPGMVGLTAMQSLAYGTPVLTHDDVHQQAPESESLTPGLTGQLFRYGDVVDLAKQIEAWFAARPDRERIRIACEDIIKRFYNPEFQARVIDRVVAGLPADDLFWQREANLYQPTADSGT